MTELLRLIETIEKFYSGRLVNLDVEECEDGHSFPSFQTEFVSVAENIFYRERESECLVLAKRALNRTKTKRLYFIDIFSTLNKLILGMGLTDRQCFLRSF